LTFERKFLLLVTKLACVKLRHLSSLKKQKERDSLKETERETDEMY